MFELVADVERWPHHLPHYRMVQVITRRGNYNLLRMACTHYAVPLGWICEMETFPEEGRIRFHHVGGITDEMVAEWQFQQVPEGVAVRVIHDMHLRWPLIGGLVDQRIIGPLFVAPISGKTLEGLKRVAEQARAGSP